jgi:hypothetical protein
MAHSYEELKKKTVAELREISAGIEHEAVKGHTQMHKAELLVALCKALGIDMQEHHHVEGIDKATVRAQIRQLKKTRDEALAAHDHSRLKQARRELHRLKRQVRGATV